MTDDDMQVIEEALEDVPIEPPSLTVELSERRHRHKWVTRFSEVDPHVVIGCKFCRAVKDEARSLRGKRNRNRGNAIEREVAAQLGLKRVGQFGSPTDVEGDYLVVQVKSGNGFPERTWKWLHAMTANANQTRAVVITDAPGPGHRRRALICLTLEDWVALHGPTKADAA